MGWQIWFILLIAVNILFWWIHTASVKKKLDEYRKEASEHRVRDEKIFRLYGDIESMMDSFEQYVSEVHDEQEQRRMELLETSRQATTLYMQVMQPGSFKQAVPSPLPQPQQREEPTPQPRKEPEQHTQSKLSPRDTQELARLATKGQKVRYLMGKGFNVSDIARELGIGKGEVSLIVDLDKL